MKTSIALLRGINVSGQKKMPMKTLTALMEDLGFTRVRTYIQSGNVVFDHKAAKASALAGMISRAILKEFGFEVPVLVLTAAELESALKESPYLKVKNATGEGVYFTFLATAPAADKLKAMKELSYPNEEFFISGLVVHLHVSKGYGNAKLNNNLFESKLKVQATTRNVATVKKLIEMAAE